MSWPQEIVRPKGLGLLPVVLVTVILAVFARPLLAEPLRMAATAFGSQAEVEVRDLPREAAETAARAALREIFDLSQLLEPSGQTSGGLGEINAAAGQPEPLVPDPRVAELLRRGLQFCWWTGGAHGPLGGEIYRVWTRGKGAMPEPADLRDAVISADCNHLALGKNGDATTVQLAAGSRIATVGMMRGFALDRAAEVLADAGVENAWLEIGGVWRAIGPGPEGRGWLVDLPPAPGSQEPIDRLWLRDQSLAIASIGPVGEGATVRLIDQRTGVPPRGVVTVVVVTSEAVDAEALASTLFIEGLREGQMRLGGLQPRPSVLWLLGQGNGTPLESSYRWSELPRIKRPRY